MVYNGYLKGVETMLDRLASLSGYDYVIAAALAFFLTYFIRRVAGIKRMIYDRDELEMNIINVDKRSVMERCAKMFPIETIVFNGSEFRKGMIVRITTLQKKVFQGEFIGKNDMDIICILTREHIIAHEIGKIAEMISVDDTIKETIKDTKSE